MNTLLNFIKSIDDKMQNLAKNNKEWFNNEKSVYRKIIRDSENFKNGILKLKVKKNSIPKFLKITKNRQSDAALLSDIKEGNKIKLIIDFFGLWIRKKNNTYYYGLYLKPILIDYRQEEEITFIEDSESENEQEKVNEILDSEFEQNYDNTESSNKKSLNLSTNISDSSCKNIELSIEPYSTLTDTSVNISKLEISNNIINEKESESENIIKESLLKNIRESESEDNKNIKESMFDNEEDSDYEDNNKVIDMYDNTSSPDDLDKFTS